MTARVKVAKIGLASGGVTVKRRVDLIDQFADLVVGADGLHSQVRRLVFGEQDRFEQYLGLKVAAFAASGYRPRDELVYVIHTELEQQVGRFSMRDDRSMFLFVFADPDPEIPSDPAEQKALLRETFSGSDWECPHILEALDKSHDLYFDRVSQIRLESWSRGGITLLGDAAFAPSLLAGQGSALAMIGAYVLAGEVMQAPQLHEGLARYEAVLHGFMLQKQRAAAAFAKSFAPRTRFAIWMRNQVTKAFAVPVVARWAFGNSLLDRIELRDYSASV